LQVFDVDGLYVAMSAHGGGAFAELPDGLERLFRATQFSPDPADWR
jgi:hypothetical protein